MIIIIHNNKKGGDHKKLNALHKNQKIGLNERMSYDGVESRKGAPERVFSAFEPSSSVFLWRT